MSCFAMKMSILLPKSFSQMYIREFGLLHIRSAMLIIHLTRCTTAVYLQAASENKEIWQLIDLDYVLSNVRRRMLRMYVLLGQRNSHEGTKTFSPYLCLGKECHVFVM